MGTYSTFRVIQHTILSIGAQHCDHEALERLLSPNIRSRHQYPQKIHGKPTFKMGF
jgi:hypothetical protein